MSEEEIVEKPVHTGKLWKRDSFHQTFEAADAVRHKLLRIWKNSNEHEGMQVKVHYLPSRHQFVVKTRLHPDFEPVKSKKKNVKRNKKNKRNNVDGKFDPQRSD